MGEVTLQSYSTGRALGWGSGGSLEYQQIFGLQL